MARHAVSGIEDFECPRIAVRGGLGGDSGDLVVIAIYDLCAVRNTAGVRKCYGHVVVVHPSLAPDLECLLLVFLSVDGHRIGGRLVRCDGHSGREHVVIGRTPLIDVLGGGQDTVSDVQLCAGEAGGHLQVGDIPVGEQVAPEGHFGGIERLIFIVQAKFSQTAVRVAIGDDAHHLGVAGLFFRQVSDALPRAYALRDAGDGGGDAIGRGFLGAPVIGFVQKIGIILLFDRSIDGKVAQSIVAVIYVDLSQGFLHTACGKGRCGQDTKQQNTGQKQG